MKNIYFLLFAFFIVNNLLGQSCLPNGIKFTTQSQIDSFKINYPNCTEIEGSVTILGYDIKNLYGLDILTSIGDTFSIRNTSLPSLSGLNNLRFIGGDFLLIFNAKLTSLKGLENLTTINGGFGIQSCSLINLTGLESLIIIKKYLAFSDNLSLISMDGLSNLSTVGGLFILDNTVQNIKGLENLRSISGNLKIESNHDLLSLSGLDNVDPGSIENINIVLNSKLSNCAIKSICNYLKNPTGIVNIGLNGDGCRFQADVEDSCAALAIASLAPDLLLLIYPNPTISDFTFESKDKGLLSISNLNGQEIFHNEISTPFSQVDISNFPSGVYFLKVISEKYVQTGKIIKK